MIKVNMASFCKFCKTSITIMYEEVIDKFLKKYYCGVCKRHVQSVEVPKE